MREDNVIILGARGSSPVSGMEFSKYGGETSCILLHMGGETILLDAGTGLFHLENRLAAEEKKLNLLLSHAHLDHIAGIPICSVFFNPSYTVSFFAAPRSGFSVRELLERLMSPPIWPVCPSAFAADLSFHNLPDAFHIGSVEVHTMEGCHPGGCTVFRLSFNGKSVVYATDYELNTSSVEKLCVFAQSCSLLLCDAQYTEQEAVQKQGYGHSSQQAAAELGERCSAGHTLLVHHAPGRSDAELEEMERSLQRQFPRCSFARTGKEVRL